jgi:SAM-dependent methyltransferase
MSPTQPTGTSTATIETIRLQAEEHPIMEEQSAGSAIDYCLWLMHLKAYDEAMRLGTIGNALDVGCNSGYGTRRMIEVADRVTGVDVSARAIEVARESAIPGRLEFLVIDGLRLPFPDSSFDLVISFQVLEHVEDPVPYLREIARVAKASATVVFTTPNAATRLDPGMTPWNRFHVREYRAAELHEELVQVFSEVRVLGMFGTPTLYETEITRVDAARQRKREEQQRQVRVVASAPPVHRSTARRIARALVPAPARSWLRVRLARKRKAVLVPATEAAAESSPAGDRMPLDEFLGFGIADLFYTDHDLDRAMDLMAICRVAPARHTADGPR